MNVILLSGGEGERLWPLSSESCSKQFIKLFKNENGKYDSMIERMYTGIRKIDNKANITIAVSKNQVEYIKEQIGNDVDLSIEPCRKDTFPAIILATSYLHDVKKIDKEEIVMVCPVDSWVDDEYFCALKSLEKLAMNPNYNISLMGIKPTYPSTKYGYIIPSNKKEIKEVKRFKEKPTEKLAQEYINEGALWNSGIFAYKIEYLLKLAHNIIEFKDYYDLLSKYESLEKNSFDYAVLEKENKIQVMQFEGKWEDMGTWNTLLKSFEEGIIGNGIMDETCKNTNIINKLNIPILCMGLENIIVVASSNGIIVTTKKEADNIKPFVEKIKEINFNEENKFCL